MIIPYVLPPETFIKNLKRAAKLEKRITKQRSHTFYLDQIASLTGFASWSLLHKKLDGMFFGDPQYNKLRNKINSGIARVLPHTAKDYVIHDLTTYLNNTFERGAYPPATETKCSYQKINVRDEIEEYYKGVYPDNLLQEAIEILEKMDSWSYDDDLIFDYDILDSGN
ncbi:MAG: hypothetical protein RBR06_02110 [Desulfuromonadaceae bacterium]|nr:hypothetical protein [Desulfuromonadaceae bacterium]